MSVVELENNNMLLETELESNDIDLIAGLDYRGPRGKEGPQGQVGPVGPSNVLTIGNVISGDTAEASIEGESPNQTLNLTIPKGDTGNPGVVISEIEPIDDEVKVWINLEGDGDEYVTVENLEIILNEKIRNIENLLQEI